MYQLSKILKTKKYIYLTRVGLGGKILKQVAGWKPKMMKNKKLKGTN